MSDMAQDRYAFGILFDHISCGLLTRPMTGNLGQKETSNPVSQMMGQYPAQYPEAQLGGSYLG